MANALLALLIAAALFGSLVWFQFKLSRGRAYNPLWQAFNYSAMAALFLGAGVLGFNLSRHSGGRFFAATRSADVIWWEVGVGVVSMFAAAYFWRKGLDAVPPQH